MRPAIAAYAAFVLLGINVGVSGVLLVAQIDDYGVDRATIGLTFFTGSAGFVVSGVLAGTLIHRFGFRTALAVGGGVFVLVGLYTATRPPFVVFVALQVITGFGAGLLESVLNAYLAAQRNATVLLNRLHAFFGVGALLGPVLASWLLGVTSWPMVWLVMAVAGIPVVAAFLALYPRTDSDPDPDLDKASTPASGGLLGVTVRQPAVLLGAALLAVYVGLEIGMGNWSFSYLIQARHQSHAVAAYSVSGYWLGLTLGRFLISPIATRMGMTATGLMTMSLTSVIVVALGISLVPVAALASGGLVLLGFFLGPIFPTAMAIAPRLTVGRLVPTAIGVMNAGSVMGSAALPWLAGVLAQDAGMWTLLPFTVLLGLLQLAVWWPMAGRVRAREG